MSRKRKSKPEPQRPGYDRGYSTSFRGADSWDWPGEPGSTGSSDNGHEGNGHDGGPGWSNAVGDGVTMGYRVIEEQIRQGQKVAEEIGSRFAGPGAAGFGSAGFQPGDVQQRMWRSYWDLASLWWDFMGSMSRGQGFPAGFPGAPDGHEHTTEPATLAIEVESERARHVGLVLNGGQPGRSLVALKLHGPDDETFRGEVDFGAIESGRPVRVVVEVAEDQAPGVYSGLVVDGSTGERLGTLTVQVEDPGSGG